VQEKYLNIVKTKDNDESNIAELQEIINKNTVKIPNFGKKEDAVGKGFTSNFSQIPNITANITQSNVIQNNVIQNNIGQNLAINKVGQSFMTNVSPSIPINNYNIQNYNINT